MNDRRQHPRTPIVESAVVRAGSKLIECVVIELSRAGARIQTSEPLPHLFQMSLTGNQAKTHTCQLVWQDDNCAGVNFLQPAE